MFLAAKATGPSGRVIAVDMTDAMIERGRENAALTGLPQIEYVKGLAESLPVPGGVADLVISNGVINLTPDKATVLIEQAGFRNVEVTWRGKPFEGASGQRKADKYELESLNIRAWKGAP